MQHYEKNVFINCPFDEDYLELFHAMTFTIIYTGFRPRSALESINSAQERLGKICNIINQYQYSIHDVSRIEPVSKSSEMLPRFNMPFEFGLFYGALHFGGRHHKKKELLVMDSEEYRYQKTLSDIAGKDPVCHENSPEKVIACVRRFLSDKIKAVNIPGESFIQEAYQEFKKALPDILAGLKITLDEIKKGHYWKEFVNAVERWMILVDKNQ